MNAAFLLVTSALMVGQGGGNPGQIVPPPGHRPAAVTSGGGDCCHDGFGHGLRDKLRALFHRDSRDCCQPTHEKQRFSLFRSHCDNACRPKIWHWQPHCHHQNSRETATCHDPCNRGGLNFLEKLKSRFHRGDRCCEGGTSGAAYYGGNIQGPPARQMPREVVPQGVRVQPAPAPITAPNAISPGPNTPNVEVSPAPIAPMLPNTPAPIPPPPSGTRPPDF